VSAQLDAAEQDLALAERDLSRTREALSAGAGSPSEIDARVAAVNRARLTLEGLRERLVTWEPRRLAAIASRDGARAEAAIAERDLARTRITAPIDGVLASVGPRAGDLLAPGTPVARIVDLTRVEVPLRVPSSAAGSVRVGDAIRIFADAEPDRAWEARLTRIAPEADAGTRTITCFAEVLQPGATPDEPGALLPGRFVTGRVRGHADGTALVVPRRAVDRDFVFVAQSAGGGENGQGAVVARVRVRVERFAAGPLPELDPVETEWAVLAPSEALPPGTPVITTNLDQLADGLLVRTARAGAPAGEPLGPGGAVGSGGTP
jgi:multidrug efflux pump subunit AcrA (membrane-fusion protein)